MRRLALWAVGILLVFGRLACGPLANTPPAPVVVAAPVLGQVVQPGPGDRTADIQAAIDAAQVSGAPVVYLLPGSGMGRAVYDVSATLVLDGTVSLVCPSGKDATLRWTGEGRGPMLRVLDSPGGTANMRIEGLWFHGGGVADGIEAARMTYGDAIRHCDFVYLRNAVTVAQSWGLIIDNCTFFKVAGQALRLESNSGGTLTRCRFMACSGTGLEPGAALVEVSGHTGTLANLQFETNNVGDRPLLHVGGRLKIVQGLYFEGHGTRQSTVAVRIAGEYHIIEQVNVCNYQVDPGIQYVLEVEGQGHSISGIRGQKFLPDSAVIRVHGPEGSSDVGWVEDYSGTGQPASALVLWDSCP